MYFNVWALSTATQWRLKAITQCCPTDSTATSAMQPGCLWCTQVNSSVNTRRCTAVRRPNGSRMVTSGRAFNDWTPGRQTSAVEKTKFKKSKVMQTASTSLLFCKFYQSNLKTESNTLSYFPFIVGNIFYFHFQQYPQGTDHTHICSAHYKDWACSQTLLSGTHSLCWQGINVWKFSQCWSQYIFLPARSIPPRGPRTAAPEPTHDYWSLALE